MPNKLNSAKNNISASGELLLYGEIGEYWDGLDALSIVHQLEQLDPNNIPVRIHSTGGLIMEGLAIYNALKQSSAFITVYIDGIAASMATVVAMAGDKIIMPSNALMMIHRPSNDVSGTAEEMRKIADSLDQFEESILNIYETRMTVDRNQIAQLLIEEKLLSADRCIGLGLADELSEPIQAAASVDLSKFKKASKNKIKKLFSYTQKDNKMPGLTKVKNTERETKRVAGIQSIGAKAKLSDSVIQGFIKNGTSVADATAKALDAVSKRDAEFVPRNHIRVGEVFTKQEAINSYAEALACRHTNLKPSDHAREYMGKSMAAMARDVLENYVGVDTRSMSDHTVLAKASHTTSDFPELLGGAGQRILLNSYFAVEAVVKQLARKNTARDFRPLTSVNLGEAPELLKVNQSGEFKHGTMAEAKETYSLDTFGRIFGMTRQALINDDLGAFTDMNMRLGKAAAEFEGSFLLNKILSNPVMDDSKTLFHATHNNLGTAGALSETTLSEARKMMRKQTGLDGKTPVDAQASFLMVPAALETVAEKLLAIISPASSADANPFAGKLQLLVDPRMDADSEIAWYLFSDPALLAVLEYAYLESEEGPQIETRNGFDVDGIEFKIRFDIGAGILDHRGAFKNAGL